MLRNAHSIARYRTQMRGVTLTEVLVATVLSTILLASGLAMFMSTAKYSTDTMEKIKLNQELMLTLESIAADLRRAGYWSNAVNMVNAMSNSNPFMTAGTDISISAGQDCVLFSYDRNDDGTIPMLNSGSDDERYGFRIRNGAVQARQTGASFNCTANSNEWQDITDKSTITVTGLSFVPETRVISNNLGNGGTSYMDIRNVLITISGYHVNKPTLTKTLSYRVRVRNDRYR